MNRLLLAAVLTLAVASGAQEASTPDAGLSLQAGASPGADAGVRAEDEEDAAETSFTVRKGAAPVLGARPTMDSFADQSTSELKVGPMRARYSLNIFGDLGLKVDSLPADHPSFFLGNVDLLLGLRLEQGFSGVAELKFGINSAAQGTIDLERFGLRWENDWFFVQLGREHTEIGYWNNAYHHGIWLQPTYARPRWIGFGETGLVPVHRIGLAVGTKLPVGPGQLKVTLSVDNSRGTTRSDVRNLSDLLDFKLLFASVEYLGLGVRDLRIGVAGILDRIPPATAVVRPSLPPTTPGPPPDGNAIDEVIGSFYLAYVGALVLVDVETFYIHQQNGARVWQNYGGFVVVSVNWRNFSPYLMVERIWRTGGPSPFFVPDPAATGALSTDNFTGNVGLRYDLTAWCALKLEYRFTRFYDQRQLMVHEGTLSWNFGL